jgi:transposase-like protein
VDRRTGSGHRPVRGSGLGKGVARTHALEALIIVGFLRGLSVCDVEALLEEALGEQVVGKSTVARICQDTRERYRAWGERALWAHDLVCCYLDAIYLKLRPDNEPAEGVLIAWGLTLEGQKVLLALQLGSRESYESWLDFGRDLTERGMRAPALVIADEAAEIWKATRELLPDAISHVQSIIIVWRDPRQRTGREDRPLKVLRDLGQPLDSARANEETHLVPRQPGGGTGRSAPRVASCLR